MASRIGKRKRSHRNDPARHYRTIAYVDGFNLFYGLRDSGFLRFYWLDVQKLASNLLTADQVLCQTNYFTARIRGSHQKDSPDEAVEREAKRKRQSVYLEALATLNCFEIIEGFYADRWPKCRKCKAKSLTHVEKQTDVALGARLVADAFLDRFDTAIVISGDADLSPAIRTVREHFPYKRMTVASPPGRRYDDIRDAAETTLHINPTMLRRSQFPDEVVRRDGHLLKRPPEWT